MESEVKRLFVRGGEKGEDDVHWLAWEVIQSVNGVKSVLFKDSSLDAALKERDRLFQETDPDLREACPACGGEDLLQQVTTFRNLFTRDSTDPKRLLIEVRTPECEQVTFDVEDFCRCRECGHTAPLSSFWIGQRAADMAREGGGDAQK